MPAHAQRHKHPEGVQPDEVEPEVERLRARVDPVFVKARRKVEGVPVKLAGGGDQGRQVPPGSPHAVLVRREQAQRSHEEGRDGLHADGEGVPRRVPRVRLRVLLPDLCQEVEPRLGAVEPAVEDDVALYDEVDEGGEGEPGDDGALALGDGREAGWWYGGGFLGVEVEKIGSRRRSIRRQRIRRRPRKKNQHSHASYSRKRGLNRPHFNSRRKSSFFHRILAIAERECLFHGENASNPHLEKRKKEKKLSRLTGRPRPCPSPDERRRAEEDGQDDPEVEHSRLIARQVGGLGRVRVLRPEGDAEEGRGGRHFVLRFIFFPLF